MSTSTGAPWSTTPQLPPIGRLDQDGHLQFTQELSAVAELLLPGEKLPWKPPELIPNTEAGVAALSRIAALISERDAAAINLNLPDPRYPRIRARAPGW